MGKSPASSARIALVVEDDPSLLAQMAKALEDEKFDVRRALDYEKAVKHLTECKPIIACIDLGLPRESGYELCEHIRQNPSFVAVPIIVTSERGYPEDMANAEDAGANAFLKKPFPMKKLVKYVGALLEKPHESRPSMRRLRLM